MARRLAARAEERRPPRGRRDLGLDLRGPGALAVAPPRPALIIFLIAAPIVQILIGTLGTLTIPKDNGCYGLTKGQFSPTADLGSKAKNGVVNDLPPIDTCALAIELGASFVARSFSGDKKQLLSVLKAAISHRGTSMLDVISPCVTFNDHDGSTKSYS